MLQYILPLGGCVHATPLVEAMSEGRVVVASRGLGLDVLRHNPHVDTLLETADPLQDLSGAVRDLKRQLKQRELRPRWVMTDLNNMRSRIALLGWRGTRARMAGFTLAEKLYDAPLQRDPSMSMIDNNLRLAHIAGFDSSHRGPCIFISEKVQLNAQRLLTEVNSNERPLALLVTQGSGGQATGWHKDRFLRVMKAMHERGMQCVLLGTHADSAAIDDLCRQDGEARSLAGRTDIPTLAAVMAQGDLGISIDTGTMHAGRAVKLPMVVLGPSWQEPLEWLPLGIENIRILRGQDKPKPSTAYRLDEIEPAKVIAAADELLRLYPPSVEARRKRIELILSSVDHRAKRKTI